MINGLFSSVDTETWIEIKEFPGYFVSDQGRVRNNATDRFLAPTIKAEGLPVVGLVRDKTQYKRSLPLLVAEAFCPRPNEEHFDTPINLDGDRMNNTARNLIWRPLWFARKYVAQFKEPHLTFNYPIQDLLTRNTYENSMTAAMTHGLLDEHIVISMTNNTFVWPTGQIFREAL